MDREDKILEMLKGLADEDIEIPASLQSDRIREKLIEEDKNKKIKRRKTMKHWMTGSLAAVGTVAAAFAVMINAGFLGSADMTGSVLNGINNVVAGKQIKAEKQKKTVKKKKFTKQVKGIKKFKNYKEMYKFLAKAAKSKNSNDYLLSTNKTLETADTAETAGENSVNNDTAKTESDYSKTNTRTEGVDEADIVKTDGKYIYVLKNSYDGAPEVRIIKTDNGKMKAITSRISLDKEKGDTSYYYNDMMVEGTTLVVFADTYKEPKDKRLYGYRANSNTAEVLFYDITNPEKPEFKTKHTQEGSIGNTRMKDGIIYTFSHTYNFNYYYLMDGNEKVDYSKLVPKVDGKKLDIGRIYVPEYSDGESYTVVTSVDVKNPEKIIDKKMIMDSGYDIYVSGENIYFWNTDYFMAGEKTMLTKYSYKNGIITPQASTSIMGTFNNDYSLDEYNGNLRIVVTKGNEWGRIIPFADEEEDAEDTTENALYILDKDLKVKGKIEGLAKGEHIKSARFMGDMAYFVTFRQTDPLFSVDVSNPESPKVLGYLKIPGFSEYLHPFGNGLLFGLGQDADEKEGGTRGLKLSMFDISNPYDVREIAKTIYSEDKYSSSDAEYDRRAITIDAGKNLVGFEVSFYDESKGKSFEKYVVYGFDREKGFYQKFGVNNLEGENFYSSDCRGLYIGDYFYIVPANANKVYSFDLKNGQAVEKIEY